MNKNSCKFVRDLLVDYDDGQLTPDQASDVSQHFTTCSACSQQLQTLQNSLALAKDIWQDAAANVQDIQFAPDKRTRTVALKRLAALAACLALAVGLSVLILPSRTAKTLPPSAIARISPAARAVRLIEREAASAKLAASAQILAEAPGGQEFAASAYRYLAQTYPQTTMGKQALTKISSN